LLKEEAKAKITYTNEGFTLQAVDPEDADTLERI
jgi:hypothetical protein